MAFPQVEATNNSKQTSSTQTHTVSLPASIQAGETLLVFFATDGDNVSTFPVGWTRIFNKNNGVLAHLAIAWRKADGGEGASITVTTGSIEQSAHISYRISGAADPAVTPPEVSTGNTGSSGNANPDRLIAGGGSKTYLWIAVEGNDDKDLVTTYPTFHTNGETYASTTGTSGCAIGIARRELLSDRSDPNNFILANSEEWVACTVGVYPAIVIGWSGGDVLGVAIGTVSKINGVALADITKVNGVA